MEQTKLVISDIQTSDLLYYDPAFGDKGYQFCRNRDIDCLPCLDDPNCFYHRNDQTQDFDQERLTDERRISGMINIFHPTLLDRFLSCHLLFVQDFGELSGAVHFSDYNKSIVGDFLYRHLAAFERNLRQLAILSELTDDDMREYFEAKKREERKAGNSGGHYQRKLKALEQEQNQRSQKPLFQQYYLSDLMGLMGNKEIIEINVNDEVRLLRNSVMHADEFVNMVNVSTPDYIYDFATFELFFKRVQAFLYDARRVENRIRLMTDIKGYWAAAVNGDATME